MQEIDLTVVIPYYNSYEALLKTLDSLYASNSYYFDCIVVDDGSEAALDQHSLSCYPQKITVIRKENGGVSSARNCGILAAKSKWISFIDSGDLVSRNYFEEFYRYKVEFPDIKLIAFSFEKTTYSTVNPLLLNGVKESVTAQYTYESYLAAVSNFKTLFTICSSFYITDIVKYISGFSSDYSHGEDHHFILRYLKVVNDMVYSKSIVFFYIQDDLNSATRRPGPVPIYGHTALLLANPRLSKNENRYLASTIADNFVVNIRKREVNAAVANFLKCRNGGVFILASLLVLRRLLTYVCK